MLTYVLTCYLVQCFVRLLFRFSKLLCSVFPMAQLKPWPCCGRCLYNGCCQLSLSLKTQLQEAVGCETKLHFTLRSKTNSSFPHCGEKSKTQPRLTVSKGATYPARTQQAAHHISVSSKRGEVFKLYLANIGTHDKNMCHHASSCLTHRLGGVGRFLSLVGL